MSVKKKYTPKNATVSATTIVVEITFARDGQFTCRISTRTSCRKRPEPLRIRRQLPHRLHQGKCVYAI